MDKYFLNLLFNYKGTIDAREFRAGASIIFLAMMIIIVYTLALPLLLNIVIDCKIDTPDIYLFRDVLSSYIPGLIPLSFISSYFSIILAIKRSRALSNISSLQLLSGGISFLFFTSLLALVKLLIFYSTKIQIPIMYNYLTYGVLVLSIIGIANHIYLSIPRRGEQSPNISAGNKLSPIEYALGIGNIMAFSAIAQLILGTIIVNGILYDRLILILATVSIQCISLALFIRYTYFRLNDAGRPISWLVGTMGVTLVFVGLLALFIQYSYDMYLITYAIVAFFIFVNLLIAAQYILFLIPSTDQRK